MISFNLYNFLPCTLRLSHKVSSIIRVVLMDLMIGLQKVEQWLKWFCFGNLNQSSMRCRYEKNYWKDINISLNSVGSDGSRSHHLFDLNTYNMDPSMMAMHIQNTCVAEFQISGTCFSKGRNSYVWITGETAICTLLLMIITSYHHVSVYCACREKERVKYMVVPCR